MEMSQSLLKSGHFRDEKKDSRNWELHFRRNPFLNQVIFESLTVDTRFCGPGQGRNPFLNQVIFERR